MSGLDETPGRPQGRDRPGRDRSAVAVLKDLAGDGQFRAVLAVLAFCLLGQWLYLRAYGVSTPWCDEWYLTPVASGQQPLTLGWLWEPANEHRAPFTRLCLFAMGSLMSWDWQLIHYSNLAIMSLGALALLLAARALRGRSELSDAFLPLVLLNPWHFETLVGYGYGYAVACGLFCLAVVLAAARWPGRSAWGLILYVATVLAVSLAGGPAGNFWALGLSWVVLVEALRGPSGRQRLVGLVGAFVIISCSILMLLTVPRNPEGEQFYSRSIREALVAALKFSVCWVGNPPLEILWPWVLVVLLVPIGYALLQVARQLGRAIGARGGRAASPPSGWDLEFVILSALMVSLAMGYGRGRYPQLWSSRYVVLTQPIGIGIYLLMVRRKAPAAITSVLALGMALCVGWSWPTSIAVEHAVHARKEPFLKALRYGAMPLTVVTEQYSESAGLPAGSRILLESLLRYREGNLSVFRKAAWRTGARSVPRPQAWEAERMTSSSAVRPVEDQAATSLVAIEPVAGAAGPGTARYEIDVPTAGQYQLCCRLKTLQENQSLAVGVDDEPPAPLAVPGFPDFHSLMIERRYRLAPGKHKVTLVFATQGVRLDLIELVPRRSPRPAPRDHPPDLQRVAAVEHSTP